MIAVDTHTGLFAVFELHGVSGLERFAFMLQGGRKVEGFKVQAWRQTTVFESLLQHFLAV